MKQRYQFFVHVILKWWQSFLDSEVIFLNLSSRFKDDGISEEARKSQEMSDLLKEKEKLLEVQHIAELSLVLCC